MKSLHMRAATSGIALCALLLLSGAAAAQTAGPDLTGRAVKRIELDAAPGADAPRIRETIRLREGDLYDVSIVRADVAALYALGEFSSVRAEALPEGDGVRVIFHIRMQPRVAAVRYAGNVGIAQDTLDGLIQAKKGIIATPYMLKADLELLKAHYRDGGYLFADLRQETKEVADGIEITYQIECGPKLNVASFRFEGNTAVPESDLRAVVVSVKEGGLLSRGRYEPSLLPSDLLAVREVFRRKGYLDATVGHEVRYDDAKERAYIVVRVAEGPLYTIRRLIIRGGTVFTPAELAAMARSTEGSPFSLEQIEKDIAAIRDAYGRKGYIKADVALDRTFDPDAPSVTVVLTISEGSQQRVGRVIIRGNRITQDHVVRRDVSLYPGEIINTDDVEESKRRLLNTGIFAASGTTASEAPVRIRFADTTDPALSDVIVEVSEGGLGMFTIGASYGSNLGFFGDFGVTLRNFDATNFPTSWRQLFRGEAFTGNAEELSLSLQIGPNYANYSLSWRNPSVWDGPYSVGFEFYDTTYRYTDFYDDNRFGFAPTIGRRFAKDLTISLTPRFEQIDISDLDSNAPAAAVAVKGSHTRVSLRLAGDYDKRDSVFFTTRGHRIKGALEVAGTFLGGDVDWVKEEIEARKWWTVWNPEGWGKHVVSIGGELGMMQSARGDVPMFDRYFIGGVGSLRGFSYRRVGPVDAPTQKQVGGEYKLIFGGEYEFPIYRDMFRWVFFADAGTLEHNLGDLTRDMRLSVGTGVRLRLPIFGAQRVPISLYLAFPVAETSADKTERFSFTVGTGFEF